MDLDMNVSIENPPHLPTNSQPDRQIMNLQGALQFKVKVLVGATPPHPHGTVTVSVLTQGRPMQRGLAMVVMGDAGG